MWIKNPTDATVCRYLFTAKLLCMFRVSQHPSSGVSQTVPAASGTGHTTCTATSLLRGLVWSGLVQIRLRGREVAVQVVWPVPEATGTVFITPDDGCCDTRNMYSSFAVNKYLHTVASVGFLFTLVHTVYHRIAQTGWKYFRRIWWINYFAMKLGICFLVIFLWPFPVLGNV